MSPAFHDLQLQVFALHSEERYQDALDLALANLDDNRDNASRIAFWVACLQCRLDRWDDALATLGGVVEAGGWFNPDRLRGDPDLAPLRELSELGGIIGACDEKRRVEQADVRPERRLVRPESSEHQPPPLVIALHMAGGNARQSEHHWRRASRDGYLLALPQGTQVLGPGEYGWSENTESELKKHLLAVAGWHAYDSARVVLGGASRGAGVAVEFALRQAPFASRGFIAVVGSPAPEKIEEHVARAVSARVRGVFITGEHDGARDRVESTYRLLHDAGMSVSLTVLPGMGHDYPPDFSEHLSEALAYVLG